MGHQTSTITTPAIVQKAIDRAEKSSYNMMDYILLKVLTHKECNETLQTLDLYGWDYVIYLYEYIEMMDTVDTAWKIHQYNESKKQR